MTRTIVFLVTLVFVLPSDGSGQAVPSPGDRIRIRQVDGTVLTGTLATLSPETIQLSVDSRTDKWWVQPAERMAEVRVARIEVLETSLGQRRNYPKYIGRTVAVTSIVGALGTVLIGNALEGGSRNWSGGSALWGFRAGAIIGLPLGVLIGSVVREERWNRVSLPAPVASDLSIRPVIGSRLGLRGLSSRRRLLTPTRQ